jgi:hypothetical protein
VFVGGCSTAADSLMGIDVPELIEIDMKRWLILWSFSGGKKKPLKNTQIYWVHNGKQKK